MSGSEKKLLSFKKMCVTELQEVLHREKVLLNNRSLMKNLPDKGESIRKVFEAIEKELKYREDLELLEKSIQNIHIKEPTEKFDEKHIQKLCEFEKTPDKERYKPFLTLRHRSKEEHMTQLISLEQSIGLLKNQDERTKDHEMKIKQERLLRIEIDSTEDGDSGSGSEKFDHSDNSDTEDVR